MLRRTLQFLSRHVKLVLEDEDLQCVDCFCHPASTVHGARGIDPDAAVRRDFSKVDEDKLQDFPVVISRVDLKECSFDKLDSFILPLSFQTGWQWFLGECTSEYIAKIFKA